MTELCSVEQLLWKLHFFFLWVFVVYAVRHLNNRRDYRESLKNRSQPFSGSTQNNHPILGHLALSHPVWLQGFCSQIASALQSQWCNRKQENLAKENKQATLDAGFIVSGFISVSPELGRIKFSSAKSITLHQLDVIKGTEMNPHSPSHLFVFLICTELILFPNIYMHWAQYMFAFKTNKQKCNYDHQKLSTERKIALKCCVDGKRQLQKSF